MREIIHRPDTPWKGFWQGFGATMLGVGVPVTSTVVISAWSDRPLEALGLCVAFSGVAALLGGAAVAGWRMIQAWAYRKYTGAS